MGMSLRELPDEMRERVIASCRKREPSTLGILVHGSYATGTAREQSDLDLDIFIAEPPSAYYRTWFEDRAGGLPLHISARSDLTLAVWEQEANEPEDWAMGIPVELEYAWLWCGDQHLKATVGDRPVLRKPGAKPEVEDMVDALLKLRHATDAGDQLGARLAAQDAARFAAPCIAALNAPEPAHDPRSALDVLLKLSLVPDHWADDLVACLGLSERPVEQTCAAAERLVLGVLRLLRTTNPHADPQPDVATYIIDGTFERLLDLQV
ncbi:nucleotidyltransferase domain-containing protein [Actinopolymorpha sp. B9G3]|uniref:nucleotidyltransferase domain-containing protein n=1 Tax=Actinopolymorpha sp. B9G3 TaxID=3158970 RepID=UPI0032D98E96